MRAAAVAIMLVVLGAACTSPPPAEPVRWGACEVGAGGPCNGEPVD